MMRSIFLVVAFAAMASAASAQQLTVSDMTQLNKDCGPDVERLCPGVTPGGGRVMACMREKKDKLSKACTDSMAKVMAARRKS